VHTDGAPESSVHRSLLSELWLATRLTVVLLFVAGAAYPVMLLIVSRFAFPREAEGSLVRDDAKASGGSNIGPANPQLLLGNGRTYAGVAAYATAYRTENGLVAGTPVPADAATASRSGIDPHISPANAELQVARIAAARTAVLTVDHIRERCAAGGRAAVNSLTAILQAAVILLVVTTLVPPSGVYLARVFSGESALYAPLRLQSFLPFYDARYLTTPMTPDLAANTAVSFATTTTWQAYAGETSMSYLSQVLGLAGQTFLAGAAGLTVGIAFIRGLANSGDERLGNFWVDVVRAVLWVLLPLATIGGVALVWQGVPMSFAPYAEVHTLEGAAQTIARGPVAALEFIKQLGTNGGGFFNVNGAHPFENPTPLANFLELLAIAVLPASLTYTFGRMIGRPRDGWVLYAVMVVFFVASIVVGQVSENAGTPALNRAASFASGAHTPNMEGKETRFGIGGSVLAAAVTSGGATGSYTAMHDSFTPLGGAMPLVNMPLGDDASDEHVWRNGHDVRIVVFNNQRLR
jgi:K+-transporting ATPase c subunit